LVFGDEWAEGTPDFISWLKPCPPVTAIGRRRRAGRPPLRRRGDASGSPGEGAGTYLISMATDH